MPNKSLTQNPNPTPAENTKVYDTVDDLLLLPDDTEEDAINRHKYWVLTRRQLNKLTDSEKRMLGVTPEEPGPILARLYVDYLKMVEKLDKCWGETYQYQKNQAMRKILDAAQMRLMEIKENLTTEIDFSELHYVDGQIIELKLIPHDLEIIPLSSIPVRRDEQLQELAERLYRGEKIYEPPKDPDENEEDVDDDHKAKPYKAYRSMLVEVDPKKVAFSNMVILLQKHERARTGRLEFFDEKYMHDLKKALEKQYQRPKSIPKDILTAAATKIQALWRGYVVRKYMKARYYRIRQEIKMDVPHWRSKALDNIQDIILEKKRKHREQKAKEYIETCVKEKERIFRQVGPGLMEDIGDEIRWWFRYWYDVALAFDKIPDEEKGGTVLVVRGETLTPQEYRIEQERLRVERMKLKANPTLQKKMQEEKAKKAKDEKERKKREKERIKKEKRDAALRRKKGIVDPFTFKETAALTTMKSADKDMDEDWTPLDESNVKNDDPIMEKIIDNKCYECQLEMRKIVDELMRAELLLLEAAHAKDRKSKKKKKDKKKRKGKKGKKGKKDPSAHRSTEDIFQELFDNRIIRQYPRTRLSEFFGEYSYNAYEKRAVDLDPLPGIGDIRQLIINNVIIPLGGNNIPKPKSVLIVGPRQSGKHLLINAICTECEAVMFDISPEKIYGRYTGKKEIKMFCHLVNKLSRILQPSVIFLDGGEKPFYKKVPKAEKKFQPKKMKKFIVKEFVKPIGPADKVMFLGTSNQPWNCTQGPFQKAYEKVIMIPRTDYGTCFQLWMDLLMKYNGVPRDFDVSSITKLTIGYPIPYIREVCERVLCPRRIIRLKFEPLTCLELLEGLMTMGQPEPISEKEYEKYRKWYNKKVKLGKTRAKIVGKRLELRLAELAAKEKEKQKKR